MSERPPCRPCDKHKADLARKARDRGMERTARAIERLPTLGQHIEPVVRRIREKRGDGVTKPAERILPRPKDKRKQ